MVGRDISPYGIGHVGAVDVVLEVGIAVAQTAKNTIAREDVFIKILFATYTDVGRIGSEVERCGVVSMIAMTEADFQGRKNFFLQMIDSVSPNALMSR